MQIIQPELQAIFYKVCPLHPWLKPTWPFGLISTILFYWTSLALFRPFLSYFDRFFSPWPFLFTLTVSFHLDRFVTEPLWPYFDHFILFDIDHTIFYYLILSPVTIITSHHQHRVFHHFITLTMIIKSISFYQITLKHLTHQQIIVLQKSIMFLSHTVLSLPPPIISVCNLIMVSTSSGGLLDSSGGL